MLLPSASFTVTYLSMVRGALFIALTFVATDQLQALAPLRDPVALNIGVNCHWQKRCMSAQRRAMKHALDYLKGHHPPEWRMQLCNWNARRSVTRVDWVGFDHCIRNAALRPPSRPKRQRR